MCGRCAGAARFGGRRCAPGPEGSCVRGGCAARCAGSAAAPRGPGPLWGVGGFLFGWRWLCVGAARSRRAGAGARAGAGEGVAALRAGALRARPRQGPGARCPVAGGAREGGPAPLEGVSVACDRQGPLQGLPRGDGARGRDAPRSGRGDPGGGDGPRPGRPARRSAPQAPGPSGPGGGSPYEGRPNGVSRDGHRREAAGSASAR